MSRGSSDDGYDSRDGEQRVPFNHFTKVIKFEHTLAIIIVTNSL